LIASSLRAFASTSQLTVRDDGRNALTSQDPKHALDNKVGYAICILIEGSGSRIHETLTTISNEISRPNGAEELSVKQCRGCL
jgi:hypothetical protein